MQSDYSSLPRVEVGLSRDELNMQQHTQLVLREIYLWAAASRPPADTDTNSVQNIQLKIYSSEYAVRIYS